MFRSEKNNFPFVSTSVVQNSVSPQGLEFLLHKILPLGLLHAVSWSRDYRLTNKSFDISKLTTCVYFHVLSDKCAFIDISPFEIWVPATWICHVLARVLLFHILCPTEIIASQLVNVYLLYKLLFQNQLTTFCFQVLAFIYIRKCNIFFQLIRRKVIF